MLQKELERERNKRLKYDLYFNSSIFKRAEIVAEHRAKQNARKSQRDSFRNNFTSSLSFINKKNTTSSKENKSVSFPKKPGLTNNIKQFKIKKIQSPLVIVKLPFMKKTHSRSQSNSIRYFDSGTSFDLVQIQARMKMTQSVKNFLQEEIKLKKINLKREKVKEIRKTLIGKFFKGEFD